MFLCVHVWISVVLVLLLSKQCGPEGFLDSINRTMKQLKVAHKNKTCLLREVALFEVEKVHRESKEQNKKFT